MVANGNMVLRGNGHGGKELAEYITVKYITGL
jgi:hypothetical protein